MFDSIRPYITKDEPFGPIDSGDIDPKDVEVMSRLFERHNWIYKNLRHRPSIIIGRKGSGKTHYLRTVYFDKQYDFYAEIRTAHLLGRISSVIQGMTADSAVFPETLSELWETILWICVFSEIRNHTLLPAEKLSLLNAYLDNLGIKPNDTVDNVLWKLADLCDDVMNQEPRDAVSEILRRLDRVTFNDAKSAVHDGLKSSKKSFVILMDSLDDFQLDMDTVSRSLQGLLKFVGAMNKPRDVVDIRFCLPSELYRRIVKISSNPNKDFRRALKLQWTASELILIGAQRLAYYLALYYPDFARRLPSLDLAKRADALALFQAVLPERLTNQAGFQEETLSYILRHTQLLPRHFLMLLNSIFKTSGATPGSKAFPISAERIINGIRKVEEYIVSEIFVAFKLIYPAAERTCKRCLPELGHIFSVGELQRTFTRHGKVVFGDDSFFDFERMLIEIGAVGRVIPGKETDIYIKGNFEYTVSHELTTGYDDDLCLHPLFSGIFSNNRKDKPVYPYGSDLSDEDYRDSFE